MLVMRKPLRQKKITTPVSPKPTTLEIRIGRKWPARTTRIARPRTPSKQGQCFKEYLLRQYSEHCENNPNKQVLTTRQRISALTCRGYRARSARQTFSTSPYSPPRSIPSAIAEVESMRCAQRHSHRISPLSAITAAHGQLRQYVAIS